MAVRYSRLSDGGRNRPLLAALETEDGIEREVYVKPSARLNLGVSGLVCEYMAARLATDLELPMPEGFLVDLDPAFIACIHDASVRKLLQDSLPVAFGSEAAGAGWRDWGAGDRLTQTQTDVALQVLVFDVLTGNMDRGGAPSNVLIRHGDLRIIDHELAFRYAIGSHEPWKIGACHNLRQPGDAHLFAAELARRPLDFAPVRARWSKLTRARIMDYAAALPPEWGAGQCVADGAATLLTQICQRLDDCLAEIQRALS